MTAAGRQESTELAAGGVGRDPNGEPAAVCRKLLTEG